MTPIRWGILGASKFARQFMGPAIHSAPGGELLALATRDKASAAPFQDFCPKLRVHDSYDALLADADIDAVYVPLPNSMHVEWSIRAAEAGKHVLCEKPVAMRESEFDDLIAARDKSGKLVAEAYMIVFHPQWQRVKSLLLDGAIGKLVHVTGAFSFDNREDRDNIRNRPETGGGALRDIGVYVFGSTRFVTGQEPESLTSRIRYENGVDVFSDIQAQFPSFSYSAYVSTRLHPHQEMVFHGEKGVIRVTTPFNAQVFGDAQVEISEGMTRTAERFSQARQYELQVAAFNSSARSGSNYPCPLEFSRGTQKMIDWAFADCPETG
jgi:predicted dehydrogenase